MIYTPNEIMEYVKQEDIKFMRFAFCDVFGNQKNISMMPSELPRAFEYGVSFDASAIRGFGYEEKSDLLLFPDTSTFKILPWQPMHDKVVRFYCDIAYPNKRPFRSDGRYILKQAIEAGRKKGLCFHVGAEYEFYLFKTDEKGEPSQIPHDKAGYLDIAPEDKGESIRREICLMLDKMNITPEGSHHEEGPGQHEVGFRYSEPLSAADNATTFKAVVKAVSAENGLFASFAPKPLEGHAGNGLHINISLTADDGTDYTMHFMAGVMAHIYEIAAFLNPSEQSYARFGELRAPKYITWSPQNRSQLIRIPAAEGEYKRIELRSPDPLANPYLAYALLIRAGLDGIEKNMIIPPATNINLYTADGKITSKLKTLPANYKMAAEAASKSEFVQSVLSKCIIEAYRQK